MAITLNNGLSDLSRELNESTSDTGTRRIEHYNDAIQWFFSLRKWPFAIKQNTSLTTTTAQTYDISSITDMRQPGGIKEIYFGDNGEQILPIEWEERNDERFNGKNVFYLSPDGAEITFKMEVTSGQTINIWYYHIPERTTNLEDTFPVPVGYRKLVALLAAAYVQWARYLDSQGNRLFNLFERQYVQAVGQQSEKPSRGNRRFLHTLAYRGFKRRY